MIKIRCLNCERMLRLPDTAAGKKARCPECMTVSPVMEQSDYEEVEEEAAEAEPAPRPKKGMQREDDDMDGRPRRKKRNRRRRREPSLEFSLIESIPLDYISQSNIGIGIGLLLNFAGGAMLAAKAGAGMIFIVLSI